MKRYFNGRITQVPEAEAQQIEARHGRGRETTTVDRLAALEQRMEALEQRLAAEGGEANGTEQREPGRGETEGGK